MKSRLKLALALGVTIGAGLFGAAGVYAQQANPAPDANSPAAAAPPAATAADDQRGGRARFSAEDRAAFFDARLAAVKAGLELTPDQQKLWDPVEAAVRAAVKARQDARQAAMTQGRPTDPIDALTRAADGATARGAVLHNLATAAQPLYASLTPDQKRRLPFLMRGMRMGMGGGRGMGDRMAMRDRMMQMMQRNRQGQGGDGRNYQYNRNYDRDGSMTNPQHM